MGTVGASAPICTNVPTVHPTRLCALSVNVHTVQKTNTVLVLLQKYFCPSRLLVGISGMPQGRGDHTSRITV